MNIFVKSQTALASLNLVYLGKVVQEQPGFRGISHLAEHLISYGVRDCEPQYEKYGIMSNASTGPLSVSFYLQGLDRYIRKFGDDYIRIILSFEPSKELFERERKVVLEEYKDCFTDQVGAYLYNQMRINYDYCGPIGYRQDLENLTYEDYIEYQRQTFSAPDKLIYVGDKEFEYDIKFGNSQLTRNFKLKNSTALELENKSQFEEKAVVHIHAPINENDLPYARFASKLLSGGMDSPLFKLIREEHALAYFVYGMPNILSLNCCSFDVITLVSKENRDFAFELIEKVLTEPEKYVSRERFEDLHFAYKIALEKEEIERYINVSKFIAPYETSIDYIIDKNLLSYESCIDFIRRSAANLYRFSDKN